MDISKLAKLLGYTTSPNDNEALNAMRMANAELDKANLTWIDFCSQKTIVIQNIVQERNGQVEGKINHPASIEKKDAEIEKMLGAVLKHLASRGKDYSGTIFIQSLADQYMKRGSLSAKQIIALEKWYNNV